MRGAAKLDPLTVKLCPADGVPAVVAKADSVPVRETKGAGAPTVPETGFVTVLLPALTVTLPDKSPCAADAAIRTITVAFTAPLVGEIIASVV